jgi:hypothetical protein
MWGGIGEARECCLERSLIIFLFVCRRKILDTRKFGQVDAEAMSVYRRALGYFAADWVWITTLVALIGVSVCVGLLEAWPLAVLIDSVLTGQPKGDWVHGFYLSVLPASKVGQIVGLVLMGMGLYIIGYLAWFGRMMIKYHLNYRAPHGCATICPGSFSTSASLIITAARKVTRSTG